VNTAKIQYSYRYQASETLSSDAELDRQQNVSWSLSQCLTVVIEFHQNPLKVAAMSLPRNGKWKKELWINQNLETASLLDQTRAIQSMSYHRLK